MCLLEGRGEGGRWSEVVEAGRKVVDVDLGAGRDVHEAEERGDLGGADAELEGGEEVAQLGVGEHA